MDATMMSKLNSMPLVGLIVRLFSRKTPVPTEPAPAKLPEPAVPASVASSSNSPANVSTQELRPRALNHAGPFISIPLVTILSKLPTEVASQMQPVAVGNLDYELEVSMIVPQLAKGAIRIPFADFKRSAPEGLFRDDRSQDKSLVELPLSEILQKLKPGLLPRRTSQRQVEVPAELTGPFGGNSTLGVTIGPLTAPSPAPPRASRNKVEADVEPAQVISPLSEDAPPNFIPGPSRLVQNHSLPPVATQVESARIPMPALHPAATSPITTELEPRVLPAPHELGPIRMSTPPPMPPPEPLCSGETKFLSVNLREISAAWPAAVLAEIADLSISGSFVALPLGAIETAVKRGKVIFSWKTIRSWIKPPLGYGNSSPLDSTALELPLKVIVPLFMVETRSGCIQRKVVVSDAIPDVFSKSVQMPEPAQDPAPAPASQTSSREASQLETNYFARKDVTSAEEEAAKLKPGGVPGTSFLKRYSSPGEIVTKAVTLPGVSGAVITLGDGFVVAHKLPSGMSADGLAAFLPQVFSRVSQSTREFRLGEMNNLSFTVGAIPWRIFKVGSLFFAAIGVETAPLPTASLSSLAGELDRKEKVS